MSDYKRLEVWKQSIQLVKIIYPLTLRLPAIERYALGDQMRRAVTSIAMNIAEGYTRNSERELSYFLSIARGSAAEVETQLIICAELGYLKDAEITEIVSKCDEIKRKLYFFIRRVQNG